MRTVEEQVALWHNRDKIKICGTCREFKDRSLEFWFKDSRQSSGFSLECRECRYKRLEANKNTLKSCTKCGESKPATTEFFYKASNIKSGLSSACVDCIRIYMNTYNLNNPKPKLPRKPRKRKDNLVPKSMRLTRIRNNGGTHTKKEIDELFNGKCTYCGTAIARGTDIPSGFIKAHLDHIVPIIKGGRNDIDNLAWACQPCNNRKSGRDLETFYKVMGWT